MLARCWEVEYHHQLAYRDIPCVSVLLLRRFYTASSLREPRCPLEECAGWSGILLPEDVFGSVVGGVLMGR